MAKKSARSKGFRSYKPETKHRSLTPKEKKLIAIGAAVIALALICALGIPALVEYSKQIKVRDGVFDTGGENIVVVNLGTSKKPRFHRIAVVDGAPEGFKQAETEHLGFGDNLPIYCFEADAEDAAIKKYYILSSSMDAEGAAENYASSIGATGTVLSASDTVEDTIGGRRVFAKHIEYESTDYETGEPQFWQVVAAYIESTFSGYSVNVLAQSKFESEEGFADEASLYDDMRKAVETVTMSER